ncbi:MAG TPA: PIN domain-containing protein [Desulfotignum sp.]|nr:PIN domain-containing protein [Desulfotignum sp.]
MHYLDTNIIVYSVVNQDPRKMEVSQSIIRDLFEKDKLLISPLNLQELIYTLSKLKIDMERIEQTYFLFQQFCKNEIDKTLIDSAFKIISRLNFGKNINDVIHLTFAEKYCTKLLTFDKDFKILKQFSSLDIQILS